LQSKLYFKDIKGSFINHSFVSRLAWHIVAAIIDYLRVQENCDYCIEFNALRSACLSLTAVLFCMEHFENSAVVLDCIEIVFRYSQVSLLKFTSVTLGCSNDTDPMCFLIISHLPVTT
jgi:hypothetical protein